MKNWKKIKTFERIHQAELRKDLLEHNGIKAVVIKKKDSAFLLGEIELWVEEQNSLKASVLLEEFNGWVKIASFVSLAPIKALDKVLKANDIFALINSNFHIESFELFVRKEDVQRSREVVEKLQGWVQIGSFDKELQCYYRTELLAKDKIESLVLKQRDSENHIEEIQLFVKQADKEKSRELLEQLSGWEKVKTLKKTESAELLADMLEAKAIPVIEVQSKDEKLQVQELALYVRETDVEEAQDLIDRHIGWTKLYEFSSIHQAELCKDILEKNNIHSVIVNQKGSMFLIGQIWLYVEQSESEKAKKLIEDFRNFGNLLDQEQTTE